MKKYEENMERKIGEEFLYHGVLLRVERKKGCEGCYFHMNEIFECPHCACSAEERTDDASVVFKRIELASDEPRKPSESESVKNDRKDNKVMMELLPWEELEEVAKVYTAGALKYGPNRWQNLPDGYQRYKGASLRHLVEVEKGNAIDEETGCYHIAQFVWNAIAMLHFKLKEYKEKKG